MNPRVYTVGQINRYIKGMFAGDGLLASVFVSGEVSNCKYHSSGHIYFSIKDSTGTLSCIMFAGNRRGLAFRMKDGDKVVVGGAVDVYERDGRYQLYAKQIRLEGEGELYEKFMKLKSKLEAEGLFDKSHKKPVPAYASVVGVVTAPTGAAVRDIQTISRRRNPYVQLILRPSLVQGEGAAQSIADGIRMLDGLTDVIIVGRGGGSYEDLWAFNEEIVARAIYECGTPVISAVGHETDTTIADFAADLRAPTPSAAAELAVFDCREFRESVRKRETAFRNFLSRKLAADEARIKWYQARLRALSPVSRLRDERRRAADCETAMERAVRERLAAAGRKAEFYASALPDRTAKVLALRQRTFSVLIAKMEGLNPISRLRQGYSFVADSGRHAVRSVKQVKKGDRLTIYVTDGTVTAGVEETVEVETYHE